MRLFYVFAAMGLLGGMFSLAAVLALGGELISRLTFRDEAAARGDRRRDLAGGRRGERDRRAVGRRLCRAPAGGVATLVQADGRRDPGHRAATRRSSSTPAAWPCSGRRRIVKPLSNFIYRTMQVGVLLIAAGTILGGVWADYSWGRFWGWDAKEVWALITLLVYLIPLHGRFAGWVNTFWLVFASVFCFLSVVMAWYGVNFVLGVGLHTYGFVEGGSQGGMLIISPACWPSPSPPPGGDTWAIGRCSESIVQRTLETAVRLALGRSGIRRRG